MKRPPEWAIRVGICIAVAVVVLGIAFVLWAIPNSPIPGFGP